MIHFGSKVGSENFFLFGLSAEKVLERQTRGYRPRQIYEENRTLSEVINFIASGALAEDAPRHVATPSCSGQQLPARTRMTSLNISALILRHIIYENTERNTA